MLKHSLFVFIIGWVLWFALDKHPAAIGAYVPARSGSLLQNFQLAFDMIKAGYWKAAYAFIWEAHFVVLSLLAGIMSSILFQSVANALRRRRSRAAMRAQAGAADGTERDE